MDHNEPEEELMRRQAEMHDDIDRLDALADDLADVWTGLRVEGGDVVVLLTEPDRYKSRLQAAVQHPDRLRFQQSRFTRVQLDEVYAQVRELLEPGSWTSHGPGLERVRVRLRANRSELANALHERFGDAIEIRLGQHRFPLETAEIRTAPRVPTSTVRLPGITTTVHPDAPGYASGDDIRGEVVVQNHGTTAVTLQTGTLAFGVLIDQTGRVCGSWNGAVTLPSRLNVVEPGSQFAHRFIAGSDTFDPRLGASLPPGTYDLVISLELENPSAPRHRDILVTDSVPIRITAPGVT